MCDWNSKTPRRSRALELRTGNCRTASARCREMGHGAPIRPARTAASTTPERQPSVMEMQMGDAPFTKRGLKHSGHRNARTHAHANDTQRTAQRRRPNLTRLRTAFISRQAASSSCACRSHGPARASAAVGTSSPATRGLAGGRPTVAERVRSARRRGGRSRRRGLAGVSAQGRGARGEGRTGGEGRGGRGGPCGGTTRAVPMRLRRRAWTSRPDTCHRPMGCDERDGK